MDVISEMLGVPQADRDTLREWADRVLHRDEGVAVVPPSAIESSARLLSYFADLVKERRQRLGPDLVSALLETEIEGERLGDRDVIAFLFLMIIAGNETTTKLLANALYWLAKNPGERDKLRRDPSLIPRWVEETLRFDNSSQALARTVTTEMELHGRVLQPGEKVLLIIGAANRDERVFPDPDRYDILRDTSHSLHFGKGSHFCLGAALARLEARVSLEELWRRLPDYEVDESALTRVHSANVRGFSTFPIEFAPAPA
jgi:cytochrome P450